MQGGMGLNVKISDILFPQSQFTNQNQEKLTSRVLWHGMVDFLSF